MNNKILIICLLFVSLIACSSDEKPKEQEEEQAKPGSIIGKWQLYQRCPFGVNSNADCENIPAERQHFYEFKKDSTVLTNRSIEGCNDGTYIYKDDELYMEFNCNSFTVPVTKLTETQFYFETNGDDGGTVHKYKIIEN